VVVVGAMGAVGGGGGVVCVCVCVISHLMMAADVTFSGEEGRNDSALRSSLRN
jgi:hypothetical protein